MKSLSEVFTVGKRCRFLQASQDLPDRRSASAARSAQVALIAVLSGIAIALTSVQGLAQQPTATPTPAPRNPDWCSDVPASPPPPHYEAENRPGAWADIRRRCINEVGVDSTCMYACQGARELWQRAKDGGLNHPLTFPLSTDKLQGPFLQPDGGRIYIVPVPPTPASSATPTAPESYVAPAGPDSSGPAPTGSFSGADLNSARARRGNFAEAGSLGA